MLVCQEPWSSPWQPCSTACVVFIFSKICMRQERGAMNAKQRKRRMIPGLS